MWLGWRIRRKKGKKEKSILSSRNRRTYTQLSISETKSMHTQTHSHICTDQQNSKVSDDGKNQEQERTENFKPSF